MKQNKLFIGMLVLAVALGVTINLSQRSQDTRRKATEVDCNEPGDKCCVMLNSDRKYCSISSSCDCFSDDRCHYFSNGSSDALCDEVNDSCCTYPDGSKLPDCSNGLTCQVKSEYMKICIKPDTPIVATSYYYSCKAAGTCDITSNKYETLDKCTASLAKVCKTPESAACKCYAKNESGLKQCNDSCKVGDVPNEPILPVEPDNPDPGPPKSCVTMTGKTVPHGKLACGTDGDNMIYICSDGAWFTHKNCLSYGQICDQGTGWEATCIANTTPRKLYKCDLKVGTKCATTDTTYTSVAACDTNLAKYNCVAPGCKCYEATNTEACDTACAGGSIVPKGCTNLENGVSVPYNHGNFRCNGSEIVVCSNGGWFSKEINCADLGQVCKAGKCEPKTAATLFFCQKISAIGTTAIDSKKTSPEECLSVAKSYKDGYTATEWDRGNIYSVCVAKASDCNNKLSPMWLCLTDTSGKKNCEKTNESHFSEATCDTYAAVYPRSGIASVKCWNSADKCTTNCSNPEKYSRRKDVYGNYLCSEQQFNNYNKFVCEVNANGEFNTGKTSEQNLAECEDGLCKLVSDCPYGSGGGFIGNGKTVCSNDGSNAIWKCGSDGKFETIERCSSPNVCKMSGDVTSCGPWVEMDGYFLDTTKGPSSDGCDHSTGKPAGCTFGKVPAGVDHFTGIEACNKYYENKCPIWYKRDKTICTSGRYNCNPIATNGIDVFKTESNSYNNLMKCTGACTYYRPHDSSGQPICDISNNKFKCELFHYPDTGQATWPQDSYSILSTCAGNCLPYWTHGTDFDSCNQLGNWVCTRTSSGTNFSGIYGYKDCTDSAGCEPHGPITLTPVPTAIPTPRVTITPTPTPTPRVTITPTLTPTSGVSCPDNKIRSDYNNDGIVNGGDFIIWRREYVDKVPGLKSDGNCDGKISLPDYSQWREAYLK